MKRYDNFQQEIIPEILLYITSTGTQRNITKSERNNFLLEINQTLYTHNIRIQDINNSVKTIQE